MDKKEFRVLMNHCFLAKKNTVEALINIIWTLHQRNQPLRNGLLNLNEAKCARSGRPKEAVIDENIKKVHKIILNNS
jgi:ABC-type cobalamin/Fe3+-siderophores transport system ATPase subunit